MLYLTVSIFYGFDESLKFTFSASVKFVFYLQVSASVCPPSPSPKTLAETLPTAHKTSDSELIYTISKFTRAYT